MPLTLEERERRAYIEGRTEEAELLSQAVDFDALGEAVSEKEEAQKERDSAYAEVDKLERELEESADTVEKLESEKQELAAAVEDFKAVIEMAS